MSRKFLTGVDVTGGILASDYVTATNLVSSSSILGYTEVKVGSATATTGGATLNPPTAFSTQFVSTLPSATGTLVSTGGANAFTVGGHTITNSSDVVPLMLKAHSTQNTNMFEVQPNGSAAPNLAVTGSGQLFSTQRMTIGFSAINSLANVVFGAGNATRVGLGIIGQTSQTADLLQLTSSTPTVLAGANANAQIFTGSTTPILTQVGGVPTGTSYGVGGLGSPTATTFQITLTSAPNLAVGDLVTVANLGFSGLTPNGTFVLTGVGNAGPYYVQYNLASTPGTISNLASSTVSAPAQSSVTARSAGTKGLVVKAAASPTTNIFEVTNSSGTAQAWVNQSFVLGCLNSISAPQWIAMNDGSVSIATPGSKNTILGGGTGTASLGGGSGVIGIANATTVPTSSTTSGGILYVDGGALTYRGTTGAGRVIVNSVGSLDLAGTLSGFLGFANGGTNTSQSANIMSNLDSTAGFSSTTASTTVGSTVKNITCSSTATITLTFPTSTAGREIRILNLGTGTVVSASANVVPRAGGSAGTAILAATAGSWAILVHNGTNWQIMAGS